MRILTILLIILMLPFFLDFTEISYGSVVIESNLNLKIQTLKEKLLTPDMTLTQEESEIIVLPETPKSAPAIQSNQQLNKLLIKERLMTPEMNFIDDGGMTEILELPETPMSPTSFSIDYHFTEDIKSEKQYIRSLMK